MNEKTTTYYQIQYKYEQEVWYDYTVPVNENEYDELVIILNRLRLDNPNTEHRMVKKEITVLDI